jgi:hypothetical protein
VWQVQDSNLRRHTPTDLQNDAAHALTCGFTDLPAQFRTDSARLSKCRGSHSTRRSALLRAPKSTQRWRPRRESHQSLIEAHQQWN